MNTMEKMDIAEKTLRKLDDKYMESNLDSYRAKKSTSAAVQELFEEPINTKNKWKMSGTAWMVLIILLLIALGVVIFSEILG